MSLPLLSRFPPGIVTNQRIHDGSVPGHIIKSLGGMLDHENRVLSNTHEFI